MRVVQQQQGEILLSVTLAPHAGGAQEEQLLVAVVLVANQLAVGPFGRLPCLIGSVGGRQASEVGDVLRFC